VRRAPPAFFDPRSDLCLAPICSLLRSLLSYLNPLPLILAPLWSRHSVQPNLSGTAREYFIIRFSPFTMRQAGKLTEAVARLEERGGLESASPQLRQLLGLGPPMGENIYV
jgi:hypothetical protein